MQIESKSSYIVIKKAALTTVDFRICYLIYCIDKNTFIVYLLCYS